MVMPRVVSPISQMPAPPLPLMRLHGPAHTPGARSPPIILCPARFAPTPASLLGRAAVPCRITPIKLPCTTLLTVPVDTSDTPFPSLPLITLHGPSHADEARTPPI